MLEDAMIFTNNSINVYRIFNENRNDEQWSLQALQAAEEYACYKFDKEINRSDYPDYDLLHTGRGTLTAESKKIPSWFKIMWHSNLLQAAALKAMIDSQTHKCKLKCLLSDFMRTRIKS